MLEVLEEKKEQVSLTRRLLEIEAEERAEFPSLSSLEREGSEEVVIKRQLMQESELTVPFVKSYLGQNYV